MSGENSRLFVISPCFYLFINFGVCLFLFFFCFCKLGVVVKWENPWSAQIMKFLKKLER